MSEAAYYLVCNRGELSVAVGVTRPEGRRIVRDLEASPAENALLAFSLHAPGLLVSQVDAIARRRVLERRPSAHWRAAW